MVQKRAIPGVAIRQGTRPAKTPCDRVLFCFNISFHNRLQRRETTLGQISACAISCLKRRRALNQPTYHHALLPWHCTGKGLASRSKRKDFVPPGWLDPVQRERRRDTHILVSVSKPAEQGLDGGSRGRAELAEGIGRLLTQAAIA